MSHKDKKYYLVVSKKKQYTHGAFEFSPEGYKKAKDYIEDTRKASKEKLIILEK